MTNQKLNQAEEIQTSKGRNGWRAQTFIMGLNGYDWQISSCKIKGGIKCYATGGKVNEINIFTFISFQDPIIDLVVSKCRATEKSVTELIKKGIAEFYQKLTLGTLPKRKVLDFEEVVKITKTPKVVSIAPKVKAPALPAKAKLPQAEIKTADLELVQYSEKSIAIFGDTKPLAKQLDDLGGRFNKFLKYEDDKKAGWIFSKKREQAVKDFIASLKDDAPKVVVEKVNVAKNEKEAAKYFKTADSLTKKAEQFTANLKHKQTNTPKRQREYNSKAIERDILNEKAAYYNAVGTAIAANNLPEILKAHVSPIKSGDCFYYFVKGSASGGYYDIHRIEKYLFEDRKEELRPIFEALIALNGAKKEKSKEEVKAERIKSLEDKLKFSKIAGFFPTPKKEVGTMATYANIQTGDDLADLSAGKGDILEYIRENYEGVNLFAAEKMACLQEILELKGFDIIGNDALKVTQQFDVILLNPPFEKGQDIAHVRYAFENNLRAGGRMVAILSSGSFSNSQKKFQAFQNWYPEFCEHEEEMIGAFKSAFRQTGVNTKMIVLQKPEMEETIEPETPKQMPAKAPKEMLIEKPKAASILNQHKSQFKVALTAKFGNYTKGMHEVFRYEYLPEGFFWNDDSFDMDGLINQILEFDTFEEFEKEYRGVLVA